VTGPAWLVLAESYSRGWRAWCKDARGRDHELGEPQPIAGYANGWRVGRGCREARFAFAPQRIAHAGYAVSVLACLLFAWLVLAGRRRGGLARREERPQAPRSPGLAPMGLPRALAIGFVVALVTGIVFALRAGVVIGPATALLLWRGVAADFLLKLSAACLAALPVLYVVFPAEDRGGFSFEFALDNLGAHWVAVVAVCALAWACALEAIAWRRARE
jgi:hypothetical protein